MWETTSGFSNREAVAEPGGSIKRAKRTGEGLGGEKGGEELEIQAPPLAENSSYAISFLQKTCSST